MKLFLKKITQFIFPFLFVIIGCSFLFKYLVKTRTDFSLPETISTIILGHSQPEGALNDSIISNTKNLCNGGEAYLYSFKKLEVVLAHNPQVKNVIVSFSNNQIEKKMDDWTYDDTHLEQYFTKYNFEMSNSDVQKAFENNFAGTLKAEFKSIIHNAKVLLKNKNAFDNRNFGGYFHIKRFKIDSLIKINYIDKLKKEQSSYISQINLDYLKKIVTLCKEKNVTISFIRIPIHPMLFSILDEDKFQKIRKDNFPEIPFLDYHAFPLTNEEFGDFDHLNYKGARKFSVYFNSEMKK